MDRTRDESMSWARMYLADFPENGTSGRAANRLWAADILRLTVPAADSLDAAWAEAEAALLEGRSLTLTRYRSLKPYYAMAHADPDADAETYAEGPTPAAALRALAAKLREVAR